MPYKINPFSGEFDYFGSASGGGTVASVSGTANRITSTGGVNPIINIAATYVGQASITTLGTVTTGTWNATTIGAIYGGTGQSTYATGDILYASAANTLSKLPAGTDTQVLTLAAGIPMWATPTVGTVTSVSGTANRITSTGGATPVIDISAAYVGQTSITTLGTITTGTWNGTTIAVANGGTGNTSFTAGSVIFSNGSILTQDNANLFYDDTNNRLGLGIVTPLDTIHVVGAMELDHTATANDDHAIEIVCNANGFSDVKAMDIDYITGALGAGQDEEAILVNIDETASTGGIVAGYLCLSTSLGGATVNGYETGININPLVHQSGTFGNADNILNVAVDVTAALASGGAGAISAFLLDNSTMTIGDAAQFGEMEIILTTPASGAGIDPLFEYSTGAATFASFVPADGTNGMRNTGAILWDPSMLAGWVVAGSGRYEIRITRQRNSLSTTPVLDELQISALTEYAWNKDGDVNIRGLSLVNALTVANGGTGRASHTAYAVICGGTTATAAQQSIASVGTAGQVLTSNGAGALPTFQANGNGDVVGPASSTDNAIARFDLATGKLIQDSGVLISDTNVITGVTSINFGGSALAFYQEGTFTPTLVGASVAGTTTYSTQVGRYTRIGNVVNISVTVVISAATGTGNMLFGAFPYTIKNVTSYDPLGPYTVSAASGNFVAGAAATSYAIIGLTNTTTAKVQAFGQTSGGTAFVNMTNASGTFRFSLMYEIN